MKNLLVALSLFAAASLGACNKGSASGQGTQAKPATAASNAPAAGAVDQSSPASVMNAVFAAAKSGDVSGLGGLCADGADGDCKHICALSTDSSHMADFKKYFASGAVQGQPRITGDKAAVDFTFGPDGKKKETMNMTRVDGKWFLSSF